MKDVAAGIIINNGSILVAKRAKGQKSEGKWEFPGGKLEPGETGEQALIREIKEELNLEIEVEGFFCESIFEYESGKIRLLVYTAYTRTRDLNLSVHDQAIWTSAQDIKNFDYAPADIPVADKVYKNMNFL